jgi:hypothetical protein
LPEPLGEEELAEQEAQAEEDRAQIEAVRQRGEQEVAATQVSLMDQLAAAQQEVAEARREAAEARREQERGVGSQEPGAAALTPALSQRETEIPSGDDALHNVHNLHTSGEKKTDASAAAARTCSAEQPENKLPATSQNCPESGASGGSATMAVGQSGADPARKPPA